MLDTPAAPTWAGPTSSDYERALWQSLSGPVEPVTLHGENGLVVRLEVGRYAGRADLGRPVAARALHRPDPRHRLRPRTPRGRTRRARRARAGRRRDPRRAAAGPRLRRHRPRPLGLRPAARRGPLAARPADRRQHRHQRRPASAASARQGPATADRRDADGGDHAGGDRRAALGCARAPPKRCSGPPIPWARIGPSALRALAEPLGYRAARDRLLGDRRFVQLSTQSTAALSG